MINHFLLICFTIIIYEYIRYIKFIELFKININLYKKIFKLFQFKNVSDFRKEKLIFNYSKSLFLTSIKIFTILLLIIILILIIELLFNSFLNLIISILGILEMSVIVIIYHKIRKINNATL